MTRLLATCLLATLLAACDDAPCATSADCFSGEVCLPDGRCREPDVSDMTTPDMAAPDMTAQDMDISTPDLPGDMTPDLADPACAGLMCGPGTCERADGTTFCLCPSDYRAEPQRCRPIPTAVAAGGAHTCAIAAGALYCWGDNASGQLGTGDNRSRPTPAPVVGMGSGVSAVSAGVQHTCAIKDDALFCWGNNEAGKVGTGSASPSTSNTPQRLTADTTTSAVGAGGSHTCATINDVLHCWGSNLFGQLGDGTTGVVTVPAPARVTPARRADLIGVGVSHTCAASAGMLSCWGAGSNGRLGNNNTDDQGTPQEVLADVNAIAAGSQHTCAIQRGALYCWGDNTVSQLGDPGVPTSGSPTPTRILADGVSNISASIGHTCAIHRGELKCWGDNSRRQAAPAAPDTTITTPGIIAVPAVIAPSAIAAGSQHTCAISDGALYCWGDNTLSQLGSGAPSPFKDAPTAVTIP